MKYTHMIVFTSKMTINPPDLIFLSKRIKLELLTVLWSLTCGLLLLYLYRAPHLSQVNLLKVRQCS